MALVREDLEEKRRLEKLWNKVQGQPYVALSSEKFVNTGHRLVIMTVSLWEVGLKREVEPRGMCHNCGTRSKTK